MKNQKLWLLLLLASAFTGTLAYADRLHMGSCATYDEMACVAPGTPCKRNGTDKNTCKDEHVGGVSSLFHCICVPN